MIIFANKITKKFKLFFCMLFLDIFAHLFFKAMTNHDIITLIKKVRKEKGFTQQEMAEKLNISQAQYAHYEVERSEMNISTFLKTLQVLNMSIKDFFNLQSNINVSELDSVIETLIDLKSKLS